MDELNFDLTRQREPATIGGRRFWLVEASADAVVRYRNALVRSARPGPDGKPTVVDGFFDAEPQLLGACLFAADAQGELPLTPEGDPDPRHRVGEQRIRSWPSRVQQALFARLKALTGGLVGDEESAEGLERQIEQAQERLAKLRASEGGAKN